MRCKNYILLALMFAGWAHASAQSMAELTIDFLENLPQDLRDATEFPLTSEERRTFVYVPAPRVGPTLHRFSSAQRQQIMDILRASLSETGYWKVHEIMALEEVLFELEGNRYKMDDGSPVRDPLRYHFYVFGDPSGTDPWGWKFEGHHVSLNFTLGQTDILSGTPLFLGSNPAVIREDDSIRMEVLRKETELGFRLVNMLSKKQLKQARFSEIAPATLVTRMEPRVHTLHPKGIPFNDLTEKQQAVFMELLNTYIDNYQLGFSSKLRKRIESAGIENLFFAWAGGMEPGIGHYYRIQGPTLLIEYDNTQNDANHVHSVVRDLTNDFAEDILRMHYENEH